MENTSKQIIASLIIFLGLMVFIAFIQKGMIEDFQKEAITRGYAEKVIEKDAIVFKWK